MRAQLVVKIAPYSSSNQVVGWEEGAVKIRLRALPEKGEANAALIDFLSEILDWPKSKILLTHGHTSRLKRLAFLDMSQEDLLSRLSRL